MRWGRGAAEPLLESLAVTELDSRPYNADFWYPPNPQVYDQYLVFLLNKHIILWDWKENIVLVWNLFVRTKLLYLQP